MFKKFNSQNFNLIEEKLINNEINDRKALRENFESISEKEEQIRCFIINNISIDPYFEQFYKFNKQKDIEFGIVSGGFINYIKWVFDKYNIHFAGSIYANQLIFKNNKIIPKFLHDIKNCMIKFGPCGNCKLNVIRKIKNVEKKKIIYIGDGLTDRCIADKVDILFAKQNSILEQYCNKKSINHIIFKNFNDILQDVKKILDGE